MLLTTSESPQASSEFPRVARARDEEERRSSMAKSSAMGSTKAINDSSEIATTHVLRAPASIAHVSACYLLHTGRRLASERAGNLLDSTDLGPVQSVAIRCFD